MDDDAEPPDYGWGEGVAIRFVKLKAERKDEGKRWREGKRTGRQEEQRQKKTRLNQSCTL